METILYPAFEWRCEFCDRIVWQSGRGENFTAPSEVCCPHCKRWFDVNVMKPKTRLLTKPFETTDADMGTGYGNGSAPCARCGKTLKPKQKRRWVHLIDGGSTILHPVSEADYEPDNGDMGLHPLGMDCVRIIGRDWTTGEP